MAFISVVQSARPGSNFFRGETVNFDVLPWTALSVSLNVIVTTLICVRLLLVRRHSKRLLPGEVLEMYTGIMAMLVESALPFSVFGIIFAVVYGKNLNVAPVFTFIWGNLCVRSRFLVPEHNCGSRADNISFWNPYRLCVLSLSFCE